MPEAREDALPPAARAFLRDAADALGVPLDLDALVIEQRVADAAGERTVRLGVEAWAAQVEPLLLHLDGGAPGAVPPSAALPHATAGYLVHIMAQLLRCDGYDDEVVLDDLRMVRGAWDAGAHVVSPTTGFDAADPTAAPKGAMHFDRSARGVGSVVVTETYVTLWGICFGTVASFSGTGAFWFDPPAELL